jgi:Zn finger protein HypA/HybF involved in hydrogenase expression
MPKGVPLSLSDILVKNSTYANTHRLKTRLIKEGLLEERCSECGVGNEWNGKPLSLQLDHRDGDNTNNELSNLRILCPNCHSQTETYSAKNTKGKRPLKPIPCCKSCGDTLKTKYSKTKLCLSCANQKKRTVERPDIGTLKKLVAENGYEYVGRQYGVSGNSIRKWLLV